MKEYYAVKVKVVNEENSKTNGKLFQVVTI